MVAANYFTSDLVLGEQFVCLACLAQRRGHGNSQLLEANLFFLQMVVPFPRHPKSLKYRARRCLVPLKIFSGDAWEVQIPNDHVFGCLGFWMMINSYTIEHGAS